MEHLGAISAVDINFLIPLLPNLPSDASEKAYRLRFMRSVCPTLPKEFDVLYLGDEENVKKRINTLLIVIHSRRPILTYMNAIMIILFYDGHLSEDDLVQYLSAYKTNIIKRWIDVDLTTKDPFIGVPSKRDFQRRPRDYRLVRMRRDLYDKGFLRVIAKVLYLSGDTKDENRYHVEHRYTYWYVYGIIQGLAANDGKYIEATNYLGQKYEAEIHKKEMPGFFQTITSPKLGEKVFQRKVSNFSNEEPRKYEYAFNDIFEWFLRDSRGIKMAARSLYGAFPEIRDILPEILDKIEYDLVYSEKWKTEIRPRILENYHE